MNDPEILEEEEKRDSTVVSDILSWVIPVVIAVVLAYVFKTYVIINATVPSSSMMNTIHKQDNLLGLRLAYQFSDPKRGDIVIFDAPDEPGIKYIKRIIGLPGDKVVVRDAKIYINDSEEPLKEDYLKEEWTIKNHGLEYEVPKNCYLMFGDNRNNSKDARYWKNTYVKREAIIAKAWVIYYPFKDVKWL